jgi:hypothetical protein
VATLTTSLTNDEYRKVKAWSKSDLDLISKSPALVEWVRNAPVDKDICPNLGTAVHSAVLEPDLFSSEYARLPNIDMRSKAGKDAADSINREIAASGKIALDSSTYNQVIAMRDSVLAHPVARTLFTSEGVSEVSIFGEINGVKVKCRPDRIVDESVLGRHIIADLKTTADIDKFNWSVRDYRYHVQDSFYSEIYEQLKGHAPQFLFVVVGVKRVFGRHPVRVFELPQFAKDKGRELYLSDLEKANEIDQFGCGFDVESLDLSRVIY